MPNFSEKFDKFISNIGGGITKVVSVTEGASEILGGEKNIAEPIPDSQEHKIRNRFIFVILAAIALNKFSRPIVEDVYSVVSPFINQRTEELLINDKVVVSTDNGSDYLLFANGNVYDVPNIIPKLQFDKVERYGSIVTSKTYKCDISGIRSGFWALYPGAEKCELVEPK